MRQKQTIAVLYGGQSGEHEISLRSAASVLHNLDADEFDILAIAIDKQGCFYINDYGEMLAYKDALPVKTKHSTPLPSLMANGQPAIEVDVVFPVMHGPLYEDGCLQGMLESMGVAYVGCGVMASAMGMDKDMARQIVRQDGINSADYVLIKATMTPAEQQDIAQQFTKAHQWPLFVKPCALGSSVGIHKVSDEQQLSDAIKDALRFDRTVLIEAFIEGREIEVAVLEDAPLHKPPRVSTPGEIKTQHHDGFYSYEAKYNQSNQTDLIIPAILSDSVTQQVQQDALAIFKRLKCQGLARLDFFVADERVYFNEINTMPGFTTISMYPKLWLYDNLSYAALLSHLIELAQQHHHINKNRLRDYQ